MNCIDKDKASPRSRQLDAKSLPAAIHPHSSRDLRSSSSPGTIAQLRLKLHQLNNMSGFFFFFLVISDFRPRRGGNFSSLSGVCYLLPTPLSPFVERSTALLIRFCDSRKFKSEVKKYYRCSHYIDYIYII